MDPGSFQKVVQENWDSVNPREIHEDHETEMVMLESKGGKEFRAFGPRDESST